MLTKTFWNYGFCIHLCLVLLIAISAYLGILPTTYKAIPHFDLVGHAVLIGLLAFFLDGVLCFRPLFPGKFSFIRIAPVIILTIAAVEEVAQSLSSHRTASLGDFIADTVGIVLCSRLARYLANRYDLEEIV
jgi:hypothetical protein